MRSKIIYSGSKPPRYYVNDVEVTQEEHDAAFPPKPIGLPMQGMFPACWPKRSKALGVHRKQVEAANARNKRMGLNTRYDKDGTAVIPDNGERRRLLRTEAMTDQDSFL